MCITIRCVSQESSYWQEKYIEGHSYSMIIGLVKSYIVRTESKSESNARGIYFVHNVCGMVAI